MKLTKLQIQIAVLFGTLALFLVTLAPFRNAGLEILSSILGAALAIEIFIFVGLEIKEGSNKHGWKHEVLDTILALVVAVIFWYALGFILNTDTPISGVVSCSMLPNLQRGDFVIVQGGEVNAHDIELSRAELDSLSDPALIYVGNQTLQVNGSMFSFCVFNRKTPVCEAFVNNPQSFVEKKGPLEYHYSSCILRLSNGSIATQPCVYSIKVKGKEYLTDFSNDIIIYSPPKGDVYSYVGDIVHRVFFRITVDDEHYYLTRGDNNPLLDSQVYDFNAKIGNRHVPQENVRGKVIFRIPYLGYFKLFISGFFNEDPQCSTQLEYEHV